jgi:transposase
VQIVDLNTEEMIDICVRLVREGVTFRASPMGYGTWSVIFTGGY